MNAVVDTWGRFVIHGAWQAAVVAVVVLALVRLGRRWSAPIRYGLLLVALAKFALPPILSSPTGLFSHWGPTAVTVEQPTMGPVVARTSDPGPGLLHAESKTPPMEPELAEPSIVFFEPEEAHPINSAAPALKSHIAWNWKAALKFVHLLGMAVVASWLLVQWLRLHRLKASASLVAEGPIYGQFEALGARLGLRRRVRLLIGPDETVPCCFGLLRPMVIVPRSLAQRPSDDLDRVLAHELAHHRRGDLWVNAVQLALFVVWWFHPMYWLLNRSLRTVREDCCDDLLLAKGLVEAGEYCETILHVASNRERSNLLAVTSSMADSPHPLAARFRRIMDRTLKRSVRLGWIGLIGLLLTAAVFLPGTGGPKGQYGLNPVSVFRGWFFANRPGRKSHPPLPIPEEPAVVPTELTLGPVLDPNGAPVCGARVWLPVHWAPDLHALGPDLPEGPISMASPGKWVVDVQEDRRLWRNWDFSARTSLLGENPFAPYLARNGQVVTAPPEAYQDSVSITEETAAGIVRKTGSGFRVETIHHLLIAETDEAGLARFPLVPEGESPRQVFVEADGLGRQEFRLDRGLRRGRLQEKRTDGDLRLRPAGRVEGRLAAEPPEAARGLYVFLQTECDRMSGNRQRGTAHAVTDEEGRFVVEHMMGGELAVETAPLRDDSLCVRVPENLQVRQDQTTELTLNAVPGILIQGTVIDHVTRKPVPGCGLAITYGSKHLPQQKVAWTDAGGGYEVYVLPGSAHRLIQQAPENYRRTEWGNSCLVKGNGRVAVEGPGPMTLPDLEIVEHHDLVGTMLGHDGREGLIVAYSKEPSARNTTLSATLDSNGSFQFKCFRTDLDLGEMEFRVRLASEQGRTRRAVVAQKNPLVLKQAPPPGHRRGDDHQRTRRGPARGARGRRYRPPDRTAWRRRPSWDSCLGGLRHDAGEDRQRWAVSFHRVSREKPLLSCDRAWSASRTGRQRQLSVDGGDRTRYLLR